MWPTTKNRGPNVFQQSRHHIPGVNPSISLILSLKLSIPINKKVNIDRKILRHFVIYNRCVFFGTTCQMYRFPTRTPVTIGRTGILWSFLDLTINLLSRNFCFLASWNLTKICIETHHITMISQSLPTWLQRAMMHRQRIFLATQTCRYLRRWRWTMRIKTHWVPQGGSEVPVDAWIALETYPLCPKWPLRDHRTVEKNDANKITTC